MRLFFVLLFFFQVAHANTDAPCIPFGDSSIESQLTEVTAAVDKLEESPFMMACHEPGQLKDRPPTGFFKSMVYRDSKGRTTRDFLKRVLEKAKARVEESARSAEVLQICLAQSPMHPNCKKVDEFAMKVLPEIVKDARYHLSMSQSPHEPRSWFRSSGTDVNKSLSHLDLYKEVPWAPITEVEKQNAKSDLKELEQNVRIKNKSLATKDKDGLVEKALLSRRMRDYQRYVTIMSEYPILQFLSGKDRLTPVAEIREAARLMQQKLDVERVYLNRLEKELDRTTGRAPLSNEVLELMNYNSEVEMTLLEEPEDCGLATSLKYIAQNNSIRSALTIGLPMMVAGFWAPPAAGLGIGLVGGGILTAMQYDEYRRAQTRTLGHLAPDSIKREVLQEYFQEKQENEEFLTKTFWTTNEAAAEDERQKQNPHLYQQKISPALREILSREYQELNLEKRMWDYSIATLPIGMGATPAMMRKVSPLIKAPVSK